MNAESYNQQVANIIALAQGEIGTIEQPPGSNNVKYNTAYYGGEVKGSSYPWCCAFVWWIFKEAGAGELFCDGTKTAYCPYVVQFARGHNQWITEGYRPGDLLLYDWDWDGIADHIGICETDTDENGYLWAIEGNCGDAVQRTRRWTGSIMGAYRPKYDTSSGADAPPSPQGEGLSGTYTVQKGDCLGLIAARFGTTIAELARINNIADVNKIWPGQVLKLAPAADTQPETVTVTLTLKRSVFARYGSVSRIEEVLAG